MNVTFHGPFLTQPTGPVIERALRGARHAIAVETQKRVKLYGKIRFRYEHSKPTGKWDAAIRTEAAADYEVVTDGGIVYGHWLNGTGSRNKTTRFKGYFMWRLALQSMQRGTATQLAEPFIERAVRELNG
jgi:hypothetical protein